MTNKSRSYLVISLLISLSVLFSCESTQEIEVGVLWKNDAHFSTSNATYLAIIEGQFDQATGFDATLMEKADVFAGNNMTRKFSISANSSSDYTAFVFVDENANGTYDEGYDIVSGYKYNCAELGECLRISVSSFY